MLRPAPHYCHSRSVEPPRCRSYSDRAGSGEPEGRPVRSRDGFDLTGRGTLRIEKSAILVALMLGGPVLAGCASNADLNALKAQVERAEASAAESRRAAATAAESARIAAESAKAASAEARAARAEAAAASEKAEKVFRTSLNK